MARLPRLVLPGQAHYLIQRAHRGAVEPGVFADAQDRGIFTAALTEAALTEAVQVHAYALLPFEVHLLATPPDAGALGRLMQAVGRRYVSAYNRRHRRRGTLWDGRYRSAAVEPGSTRLAVLCLIDSLSADAGITSAGHRTGSRRDPLLTDPPEFWQLGNTPFEREAAWRGLLAQGVAQTQTDDLQRAALGGWAAGSATFALDAAESAARPASPRPRGRPRAEA